MDLELNIGREAGSGKCLAIEKNAEVILEGESIDRASVSPCRIEKRDVKEYRTGTHEIYWSRYEAPSKRKFAVQGGIEGRAKGTPRTKLMDSLAKLMGRCN